MTGKVSSRTFKSLEEGEGGLWRKCNINRKQDGRGEGLGFSAEFIRPITPPIYPEFSAPNGTCFDTRADEQPISIDPISNRLHEKNIHQSSGVIGCEREPFRLGGES